MSRAITPARNRSASRPAIRYLYSGDVSKMPALLRTAKYSCFADMLVLQRRQVAGPVAHRPVC